MSCAARFALVGIFLVATVDDSAVLIRRMPYLSPVPTSAAAAFDFICEDAYTAVLPVLLSTLYLRLDKVEQVRRDNRLVVLLHIVLRNLARILPARLIEEVRRILFLDQRIATILLVCEDGAHCRNVPLVLSRRRFDAPLLQFLGDGVEGSTSEEELVDELHRLRLFLVDFKVLVIAEECAVSHTGFSLSALYRVHPESTAKYLVETDPAFTDRKKFLSSDYMYNRLKWDPDKIPKRIGDGFYEQQLLAEQILKQTGKRHLDGYTDDETAFQALMDAGITYAKEMNLSPGIKLSKEQIAALTSDMIWLEEREVYVNGKKERAVYPVLYTKNTQGLRLTKGGSLISARNIIVETKDALKNAGTLYGENILVNAGEIENTGLIRAKNIGLTSTNDINIRGSVIGDKKVILDAKNNITAESTTEKLTHQDVLNTTAGIAVKGDEGVLVMSAGKNIALAGATLAALGKNGSVLLSAGENISLDTKKLQSEKDMTVSAENYLRTKRGTELAAEIRADGNVSIAAGNDLTARAATIESKSGTASLSAGNDISLTEGREISEDHYGIRYKESGLLSTKTTTIRTDTESDTAITSKVTGKNVSITAKRDASFTAADIAADHDVTVTAGRNVSAASADNYVHTENFKSVKTSGIFSAGGGLGFTIGTQQTKTTQDSDGLTRQGTNIAALGGNVSVSAGENAHISSSNILADKDANISAKETVIDGKSNIYRESITQESKTTGLTVSFSHGLLDLGQSLYAPISRMGEVQDDRLKAAYALQARRLIREKFGKGKNPLKGQTFSLDISFGTSKSYSRMESTTTEYAGSRIASGGNTNISAGERDLTVKGSTVIGNDVSLTAKGNVRLEAGENTSITTTENKFSSASIGASFAPSGLTDISVSANKANGNSKESVTSYSPTLVSAKNDLSLTSGKDMDIIGSKAQGDKITAKVGGNLNVETLQEKETYEEDNHSTGFGVSWNVNFFDKTTDKLVAPGSKNAYRKFSMPNIGGSFSKGNIDSHYRSARDQAGFFAGSKGFDIYVEKNTDLKGGVIASNAAPDKNHLFTGTFSFSDLKNEADYSAKSIGAAYHKYGNYKNMTEDEQNKVYNTIGLAPNLSMPVKGDASSTTKSVVAAGTIDIRENKAQDISALSRNTANSLNELGRIFDKAKIEEQQELAAVFGEEAFRLVHNLKDDGSGRKIAIHFALGGIMSAITGAGFASGAIGAGLNEALINNLKGLDPGTAQIVSGIIGAAAAKVVGGNALAGASAAASGTKWNKYQKDPRIKEKLQEILKNEKFDDLKENERIIVVKQDENGNTISVSVDSEGNLKDLDLPPEYADAYPEIKNGAVIVRRVTLGSATDDGNTFTVSWGEKDGHISNLIPEPNQLKDRGEQTFSFEKFSFTTHKVLDFLGYIPAVGSAASIADGILYVADGNYEEAIRSVGMIIPGAKYLKAAKKLTGVLGISRLIRTEKNVPARLPAGKPASSSIPLEDLGRIKPGSKDIYMPDGKSLRPNIQYKAGEFEYLYKTDEAGRLIQFKTDNLQLTERDKRLRHNPNTPGKQEGDQAAHLAADRFGGSPELANLVSQSLHVNLSTYKKLENEWAKAIKEGKNVQVEVNVIYEGASKRPAKFVVIHTIEGKDSVKTTILNK